MTACRALRHRQSHVIRGWAGVRLASPNPGRKLDASRQACGHRRHPESGCPNVPIRPARISRFGSQHPIMHGSSRGRLAFQACRGLQPGARISALLWRPGNRFPGGRPQPTSRRYGSPWSRADHCGSLPRRYSVFRASRACPTCCPTQQFLIGAGTPEVCRRMFAAENEDMEQGFLRHWA